jgi:hypothetical protein
MAIKSKYKRKNKKIEIDLTGPDGNAFVLLGYAKRLSRELGLDHKQILDEMMEGNYENLINVFDKYFGDFVDLYR